MKDDMPKGYTCKCGKFNQYEIYVYAHWDIVLIHTCECGRDNRLLRGIAKIATKPKRKVKSK